MKNQVIISIGREYGIDAHKIANMLADRFRMKIYDKNIIKDIAKEKNVDVAELEKFEEMPRNIFFSRSVSGHSNSPEEVVAQMQFDFLKNKAETKQSFIVVGRCANSVLKDYDGLISIFLTADEDYKQKYIKKEYSVDDKEAADILRKGNKKRKTYHNFYCKEKWGDSRYYDLLINISKIDAKTVVDLIEAYVNATE